MSNYNTIGTSKMKGQEQKLGLIKDRWVDERLRGQEEGGQSPWKGKWGLKAASSSNRTVSNTLLLDGTAQCLLCCASASQCFLLKTHRMRRRPLPAPSPSHLAAFLCFAQLVSHLVSGMNIGASLIYFTFCSKIQIVVKSCKFKIQHNSTHNRLVTEV